MPWPPSSRINNYRGPYPISQLENARRVLIRNLTNCQKNSELELVKPLMGINNSFRVGRKPTPVLIPELRGHNIDTASLPESAYTCSYDSSYYLEGPTTEVSKEWTKYVLPSTHGIATGNGPVYGRQTETALGESSSLSLPNVNNRKVSATISSPGQMEAINDQRNDKEILTDIKASVSNVNKGYESLKRKHDEDPTEESEAKKSKGYPTLNFNRHHSADQSRPSMSNAATIQTKQWSQQDIIVFKGDISAYPKEKLSFIYKCDFCYKTFGLNEDELKSHLSDARHFSGSLYQAHVGTKLELVSVYRMRAVENITKNLANMAICLDCDFTSHCAFTTALHNIYQHHNSIGSYCIVSVVEDKFVELSSKSTCLPCNFTYSKSAKLNKHWMNYPNHAPEISIKSNDTMFVAYCPFCDLSIRHDIRSVRTHVMSKHAHLLTNARMHIPVKITKLGIIRDVMPRLRASPSSSRDQDELASLEKELYILTSLVAKGFKNHSIHSRYQELTNYLL